LIDVLIATAILALLLLCGGCMMARVAASPYVEATAYTANDDQEGGALAIGLQFYPVPRDYFRPTLVSSAPYGSDAPEAYPAAAQTAAPVSDIPTKKPPVDVAIRGRGWSVTNTALTAIITAVVSIVLAIVNAKYGVVGKVKRTLGGLEKLGKADPK